MRIKINPILIIFLFTSINILHSQGITAKLNSQNDNLLFGSLNTKFYSFNTATKKTNWSFEAANPIYSQAEIINNKIVFGDGNGIVYCLSPEGKEIWKRNLGTYNPVVNKPIALNENILITSSSKLFILNQNDGTIIKDFFISMPITSPISLTSENSILFADRLGKIYKLNEEGVLIDSYQAIEDPIFGKIIVVDNCLFFGSNDKNFYKYDLNQKNITFKIETGDWVSSTPLREENKIYFGNDNGNFYCIDKNNGNVLWKFKTQGSIRTEPLIIGNLVIFGGDDKNLYILNKTTGKLVKKFLAKEKIKSSPVFVNKAIYFADESGGIYQIDINFKSIKTIFKTTGSNIETVKKIQTVK